MSQSLPASLLRSNPGRTGGHRPDRWFSLLTRGFALVVVALFLGMLLQLALASEESFEEFGWGFVLSSEWNPVKEEFGALPFIYGTVASSLLALLLAVPIGIGGAIFLVEMAPRWLLSQLGFLIELLAAIPSVVYGLWGIFALAPLLRESVQPALSQSLGFLPFFAGSPSGYGLMAAGIVLAIMILPTIASVSREVLSAVPSSLREVGLSLGATRAEVIWKVVLPTARSGLVGAVILGLGRALGETMAVTMLIGNRPEISASLFAPAYSMASVIANEFTEATAAVHLAALAEIALLLLGLTVILNVVARMLVMRVSGAGAR